MHSRFSTEIHNCSFIDLGSLGLLGLGWEGGDSGGLLGALCWCPISIILLGFWSGSVLTSVFTCESVKSGLKSCFTSIFGMPVGGGWGVEFEVGILIGGWEFWFGLLRALFVGKGKSGSVLGTGFEEFTGLFGIDGLGIPRFEPGGRGPGRETGLGPGVLPPGKGGRGPTWSPTWGFLRRSSSWERFSIQEKSSSVRKFQYCKFSVKMFQNFQNLIRNQPFVSYKFSLQAYGNTLRECWLLCTYLPRPLNINFILKTYSLYVKFEKNTEINHNVAKK